MRWNIRTIGCVLLVILVSASPASADIVFDANADFVAGSTVVNGVWSYGYKATSGGSLVIFNEYVQDSQSFSWRKNPNSLGTPGFWKNISSGVLNGIDLGNVSLHPGPSAELAVLRFTATFSANYSLMSMYETGDASETSVYVIHNNDESNPLFFDADTTGGGSYSNLVLFLRDENKISKRGRQTPEVLFSSLNVGDTTDLVVGENGSFY